MVKNDSFSSLFASPSFRKGHDSFNDSFSDKNNITNSSIIRTIQKENDQIVSCLRFNSPSPSQYRIALSELVVLYEKAEETIGENYQRLIISHFLKSCANILSVLKKDKFQLLLYRMAQLISNSIEFESENEDPHELSLFKKWTDRIVIESSIPLIDYPSYQVDLDFSVEDIIDDLSLSNGSIQYLRAPIFEAGRSICQTLDINEKIDGLGRMSLDNAADEAYLQLILWAYKKNNSFLDNLGSLFPDLPISPDPNNHLQASLSLLDVKLYIVSLATVAINTLDSGMTAKYEPTVACQFTITKIQRQCWEAVVSYCKSSQTSASVRLRISQLIESVRLINDGSEDVRVLFEAWKECLQIKLTEDGDKIETSEELIQKLYREKMNTILSYGPFYSKGPSAFGKISSDGRRDIKSLFPLQFDYEFVDTTEAGHIGVVINSLEGYIKPKVEKIELEKGDYEENLELEQNSQDNSFETASDYSDHLNQSNYSNYFSPLKNNRHSIAPGYLTQLTRDQMNTSMISTKSLIMTPSKMDGNQSSSIPIFRNSATPKKDFFGNTTRTPLKVLFEKEHETEQDVAKEEEEAEDKEIDPLEAALLESSVKHEEKMQKQRETGGEYSFSKNDVFGEKGNSSLHSTPNKSIIYKTIEMKFLQDAETSTDKSDDILPSLSPQITINEQNEQISGVNEMEKNDKSEKTIGEVNESKEGEEEDESIDLDESYSNILSQEEDDHLMFKLFEATTQMLQDFTVTRVPLSNKKSEPIFEQTFKSEDNETKLEKISTDLEQIVEKIKELTIPVEREPVSIDKRVVNCFEISDHNPTRCLGCQSDQKQESALRLLEDLAVSFDSIGCDYN